MMLNLENIKQKAKQTPKNTISNKVTNSPDFIKFWLITSTLKKKKSYLFTGYLYLLHSHSMLTQYFNQTNVYVYSNFIFAYPFWMLFHHQQPQVLWWIQIPQPTVPAFVCMHMTDHRHSWVWHSMWAVRGFTVLLWGAF